MIVPYVAIRNVLVQKDLGEKRAHWMLALQEYDLEINPAKIVIQQGLCLPAAQSNDPEQEQQWIQEEDMSIDTTDVISAPSFEWYDDIRFYLTYGYAPPTLDFKKRRTMRLKATPYQFIDNVLFRRNYDGVFLRCLEKLEAKNLLFEMHVGPARGHFSGETTAHKVLRVGYYCPALFKDAHIVVKKCEAC